MGVQKGSTRRVGSRRWEETLCSHHAVRAMYGQGGTMGLEGVNLVLE